jgi:hypothetical protein
VTPWDVAAHSRFVTSDGTALHVVGHSRLIAAELVIYFGAGHMLPFERGREVTARIGGLA